MLTSSKSHVSLITFLVFFERSYAVPHTGKVSELGLHWLRIFEGQGGGGDLISKKPRRVRFKMGDITQFTNFISLTTVRKTEAIVRYLSTL